MKSAKFLVKCQQSFCSHTGTNGKDNNCKNLVLYGSNLGSTLGMDRFSKTLQNLIFLTPNFYSIVVGQLLSEGWLEKYSLNSNTRFKFKQSVERAYFVFVSFMFLYVYYSSLSRLTKTNSKRKGKIHSGL